MARIFKVEERQQQQMHEYARHDLEEFAEADPEELAPDADLEEAPPPPDPEEERQAILAEAREEAARKVQEAYNEGLNRGMEAGQEAFQASLAEVRQTLDTAAAIMQQAREAFLESLEPQVVALVTLMARRILNAELATSEDRIRQTARRALEMIADAQRVTLFVHPEDLDALREHKVTLLEEFDLIEEVRLEADAQVAPGSCVANTDKLQVDAQWETLMNNLLEDMLE
jgi:flagellar biosynthesis/type III secretory pathway protein FliH